MAKPKNLPFHRAWRKPGVDFKAYDKLVVAKVNTDYLAKQDWVKKIQLRDLDEGVADLALYAEKSFREGFVRDEKKRFQVVESRGPKTLTLEIALVEVVPTRAALNALSYAFFYVPMSKGSVAMEGRLRDGTTGEILATFADRETGKTAVFSLDDLTWYGHAHQIIDEWAEQLVKIANKAEDEIVNDSRPFTLMPW